MTYIKIIGDPDLVQVINELDEVEGQYTKEEVETMISDHQLQISYIEELIVEKNKMLILFD